MTIHMFTQAQIVAAPLLPLLPSVLALALAAIRWAPTLMLVPLFGAHALSGMARAAVALALALPIAPSLLPVLQTAPPSLAAIIGLAGKELAAGFVVALLLAIPFWAVEAAGTCIDYQRGANPQALDPAASADASVFGTMLRQASCVYLMHAGALHALCAVIYTSFTIWPVLEWLPLTNARAGEAIIPLLAALMRFTALLALPFMLALGLIEAGFAVLSKASPRLPAYVAALPFKSIVALLVVALSLPALLEAMHMVVLTQVDTATHWMRHAIDAAQPQR